MKLKFKFKLDYIIQLSYYNSELISFTVGADLGESVSPKTGPIFVCELPARSSYVIEVPLLISKPLICESVAR